MPAASVSCRNTSVPPAVNATYLPFVDRDGWVASGIGFPVPSTLITVPAEVANRGPRLATTTLRTPVTVK